MLVDWSHPAPLSKFGLNICLPFCVRVVVARTSACIFQWDHIQNPGSSLGN